MSFVSSALQKATSTLERRFQPNMSNVDGSDWPVSQVRTVRTAVDSFGEADALRVPKPIRTRKRFIRELGIVTAFYFVYFGARGLTVGDFNDAFANAKAIVDFETALGLFVEPAIQAVLISYDWTLKLAGWLYLFGHLPVIGLAGGWLYWKKWDRYRLYRNALFISGALGLVMYVLYPVAPPRLIGELFIDTVTKYSNVYHLMQPSWLTNQLAALPSLHFGWNLIVGIALLRETHHLLGQALGVASPLIMLA